MKFIPASLLLILLVSSLSPAHGVLEAFNTNLKCKCTGTTSSWSVLKARSKVVKVHFVPPGNGCPRQEIIVKLKNKSIVCLNPNAEWVQSLLKRFWQKKNSALFSPVPTKTETA